MQVNKSMGKQSDKSRIYKTSVLDFEKSMPLKRKEAVLD